MAKKEKTEAAPAKKSEKAEAKGTNGEAKKEAAPEFKYGVKDLAEKLGIKETSVRVKLRNAEVEKAGRSYGWNTKDELNAVIAAISKKAEKAEEAEDDE